MVEVQAAVQAAQREPEPELRRQLVNTNTTRTVGLQMHWGVQQLRLPASPLPAGLQV
jgi:hypothetical protein